METGLNVPREIRVATGSPGVPSAVILRKRPLRVKRILEAWRIDDEWWREEVSRQYYRVVLEDGLVETFFRDLVSGKWYRQRC